MKKLLTILSVLLLTPFVASAAYITVPQSTAYGQVLIGNATGGNYTPVATTTLNVTANSINGLITQGSNITITGNGTAAVPYNISSTGGSGGSSFGQVFEEYGGGAWIAPTTTIGAILQASSTIISLSSTYATTTYATSTNLYTSGQTILAATNGKVGIGTSSPTNLLDIAAGGNGNISLFVHGTSVQSSLSPQVLHLNDSYGSNNSGQSIDGTSGSLTFTTASNSIIFKPGGSEAARITSSGDLAIGTTSPYAEVAVAALPANYNANILTVSSSTAAFATTTLLNFNSNGQLLLQSTDSTATHLLSIGGSGSFWVRNDGAITASKISTGHITINNYDHVIQSTDNNSLILGGSSLNPSTTGPTLYLNANNGSSDYSAFLDNGIEMMRITNNGNVGIGSSTPWGLLSIASSTAVGVPQTGPMFVVGTSTLSLGATTTDFIVDQNGNVGVHTSTPTSALYVVGTLTVQAPGINGATIKSGYNQGNGELDLAANGASPVILRTNGEVDITSAPYLAKSNSLSVAGNIYTAANLGIGTTTPFATLSVGGSAYIGGNLTATGTVATGGSVGISSSTPWAMLSIATSTVGQQLYPYFDIASTTLSSGATTTIFEIDQNGKVGISTSSPFATLSVNDVAGTIPFNIGSSTGSYFTINQAGGIELSASQPATSTSMNLDWSATPPQVEYQLGTGATTITIVNATTSRQWGSRKLVVLCNPGTTGTATTFVGVEWIGTAPTFTTTASQCDIASFDVMRATSTNAYKVAGAVSTGLQ